LQIMKRIIWPTLLVSTVLMTGWWSSFRHASRNSAWIAAGEDVTDVSDILDIPSTEAQAAYDPYFVTVNYFPRIFFPVAKPVSAGVSVAR
jgi:hypothetical protein